MAKTHLGFCVLLHRALAGDTRESLCWSPYSVAAALAMAASGAGGTTKDELLAVLTGGEADLAGQIDLLRRAGELPVAENLEPPELAVFNTLFARDDLGISDGFVAELAALNGSVRAAPFGADPEAARTLINSAVAQTTRGLISQLVPPGAVDPDTVAALVNALYLKASWLTPFDDAVDAPFHAPDGDVDVPTMRVSTQLGYAELDGWQVVSLPGAGGVQVDVLLPADLASMESEVDADLLARLLDAPRSTLVELWLPRLRVQLGASLRRVLTAVGAPTMFEQDADFSDISAQPVHISDVLHESVLRLDEGGLEGAAATAALVQLTSAPVRPPTPVVVRVDRPFLLLVRHRDTGAVYFLARIVEPNI